MNVAPYGSWPSPVSIDDLLAGSVRLGDVALEDGSVYWTEARASDGGRTSLWRRPADADPVELTPNHNVRTRVHEYGGGAWDVDGGTVVFSDFSSNRLFVLESAGPSAGPAAVGTVRPLTGENPAHRYADLRVHADRGFVLAVREDHSESDLACRNEIVAVSLDDGAVTVLVHGADFYLSPELGPDSRIAWCEWNHPNMPWDTTTIRCGTLLPDPSDPATLCVTDVTAVIGGKHESALYPMWRPNGELVCVTDASGYWNFVVWDGQRVRPLHEDPHDYSRPAWTLGRGPAAILDDRRLVCVRNLDGYEQLGLLAEGLFTPLPCSGVDIEALATDGRQVVVTSTPADRPSGLTVLTLADGHTRQLRTASEQSLDAAALSQPTALVWEGSSGETYGWYYPPTSADTAAPDEELPPLIVRSHGGPTGNASASYNLGVQFWTSRGFAVLDVNYSGSSGYGRHYRHRLAGRWGIADVDDCLTGVQHVLARRLADPRRVTIEGGSAGGYTTLRALTTSDVFAAGVSSYGIGDLETLATDTHKFEARYLDGLIGPYPQARDIYVERSPIHHIDRLATPMLILQGLDDAVVPPSQATAMADAVRAKGLPVALLMFAGEGHGFRRAETLRTVVEAKLSFYGQVLGFSPADAVPELSLGQ